MKKAKRALALALVFALVASFCVTGAAAEPGQGEQTQNIVYGSYGQDGWSQTEGGDGSYTDSTSGVTVSKTATATGTNNQYEVTLEVEVPVTTNTKSDSAATVLVIDVSGSMDYCAECGGEREHKDGCSCTVGRDEEWIGGLLGHYGYPVLEKDTRIYAAREAAKDFIASFADDSENGAERYVGIVTFAYSGEIKSTGEYSRRTYWFNVSTLNGIENATSIINVLSADGGTDLEEGLSSAASMFSNHQYNTAIEGITNKYAIVLTDGDPDDAEGAINDANSLQRQATVYTVCFGASDDSFYWRPDGDRQETTVSEYLRDYIATSADTAYDADDAEGLYAAFEALTEDIEDSLKNLTVIDPMADGVTLDSNSIEDSGAEVNGQTINWTLGNNYIEGDETRTYTLTYTVTVDPAAFEDQKADYYPLNGETYLRIPAQDEGETESIVQFPVPGVFVTPTSTETPQDVYVYVQVVNDDKSELTPGQIEQIHGWGLTTLNDHGYYTIGVMPNITLPAASEEYSEGLAQNEINEVATRDNLSTIEKHSDNAGFIIDEKIEWVKLHTDGGADGYSTPGEKYYVSSSTSCWHLNGQITLTELKQELVDVVYQDGVDGSAFPNQTYKAYPGTATPRFTGTPEREGYTFTGWQSSLDGETYTDEQLDEMTVTQDVTYTAQWSRNAGDITIEVYLDGEKVELTDDTHLKSYISNLTDDAGTPTFKYTVEDGVIKGTYNYEQFDSADIVLTPNSDYILQGIEGTFIQGSNAWQSITQQSGDGWKIDNVMGESTLKVYLNTKYSVEYGVPFGTAPTDDDTYITVEGVGTANAPSFDGVTDPNEGVDGSWKNPNETIKTQITLATLPDGTTGWYDEVNTTTNPHSGGSTLNVDDAVDDKLNGDDNTFTFTATAVNYTVTYTDGVDGEEVFADQVTADIKHGAATPDFLVDGSPADPEREGYTFEGWEPEVAETVTGNATYVAQWEEITGTLTVTKTFSGLDEDVLPSNFAITVAKDGETVKTLELKDAQVNGTTYTWTINDLSLGTYTVSESGYDVEGYAFDEDESTTSVDATLVEGETVAATAELKNVYIKDEPGLSVEKTVHSVNGSTDIPEKVEVDDVIVYKIVVENTGNVALTGISVTDKLVNSVLYSDEGCTVTASAMIESLDAGDSETFYAKYEVTAADAEAGSVTNTATATDGDTTDDGEVTVEVKEQYTLTVNHRYDTQDGEVFETETETLNEGDEWSATAKADVERDGVNYIFDASLSTSPLSGTISDKDVVVNLVYVKDELNDEDDTEEGGDDIPDYKQAVIKYVVEPDGAGTVSNAIDVVTLNSVDDTYKDTVTADSTATPAAGNVFVNWTHEDNEVSSRAMLDYEFIAEGGQTYVFTAHFRAGTTGASVDKQLVSYVRDGETASEVPEGFKALVGDVLNYEISVKNTGEVALNTTVTDSITGAGTLTINDGEGYTVEDGVITINGLAPEVTVTITASYTVVAADAGKTITNTATADLPGDEPGDDPTGEEEVTVDEYGITVTPADITIYMGGDEGYEAVVGENGQVISDNNSLPTPLFTVELSESFGELSVEQIEAIEIAGTTSDAGTRGWRFDYAGKAEDGTDLYYIVPDAGQEPIRVTYTDGEGIAVVSDHFDPATIDELFAEFTIKLYTGTVTSVTAEVKGITCEIDYDGTGTLTVRAVDDTDENPVVGVQVALPRPVEAGEGAVTAPAGTTYTLNETTVAADAAGVGLLFDGIIDDGADRTGALLAELESELGVTVEDGNYQAQYLDLVDAHNGNAWVKASGEVTVYWGYPEGTGEDTDFALYHFEGLHREGTNSGFDIADVATSDIERVTITKTANGIAFDIGSGGFSPFVLVWDDGDGGAKPWWPPIGPGDDDDDGDDDVDREFVPKWLNIDDHYAYIIGYEDGTVRPQGNITRAEVATIFFRLLTDEVRAEYWSTVSGYTDVKAGDWYNNAISTLSDLGIITGYEDGTFRPNASISRAEFVTIATRFFDYAAEYEGAFSDVSYSSWYADFVQAAVDMGLVNGYENGTFRPNASITRAEAVAIVNRVLLRRPDADHLLPWSVMNTFSDNVLESAWYYEDIQEATNSHDYEWLKSGVEDWTEKLPERDWAALEREWSKAYDAPGGEVTA